VSINTISCTPGQLPSLLKYLYKLKLAAFLWGEPGVGKSMCVQQFTKEEDMLLEDVRLTQMDAPDLRGLQWVDEVAGITKSFRPEFFPIKDVKGCVFLDELTAAEPRMQATAYQLVLDRRIGPHILPPQWMVIGAGNCPEDGAISYKMGSALSDRFVHVLVVANAQDWLSWAVQNDIHPSVLSFIRVKPDYLTTVQGQSKGAKLICPSPRSWHRVSQVMQQVDDATCNSILINGIVGDAAAVEFKHTVEEISELPEMSYLLQLTPAQAARKVPMKISCLYGLAYSMAGYVQKAQQIDGAMAIFDAVRKIKTDQPVAEIETLANEMLLDKAIRLGVHGDVVRMPAYQNYTPRAKQIARS
jgi:ATPase family associated with various cellular activities (AAA)